MTTPLPSFLRAYEPLLQALALPVLRIEAEPIMEALTEDPIPLLESKIGGVPYFPDDQHWPTDTHGDYMLPIAQINFSRVPVLQGFPTAGILQLFLSPTSWYDNDAKVVFHPQETLNQLPLADFGFLEESIFAESPVQSVHRLSFRHDLDRGSSSDYRLEQFFQNQLPPNFTDQLTPEESEQLDDYFDGSGHKIGGYGAFTQDDPRAYPEASDKSVQLLQLDTDDYITWGDMGIGHLLINPDDLRTGHLEKAVFYWDCH
jgi:uncharacterized protein YwqG